MDKHNPLRRTVLRGAVAGGWVLGLPLLGGCKGEEQSGQAPASADAPSAPPSAPPAPASEAPSSPATSPPPSTQAPDAADKPSESQGAAGQKVSQAQAQYQPTPKGEDKCSTCMHFKAESNTCEVVEGEISPDGWCTLWVKAA